MQKKRKKTNIQKKKKKKKKKKIWKKKKKKLKKVHSFLGYHQQWQITFITLNNNGFRLLSIFPTAIKPTPC